MNQYNGQDDTICAIATPPGIGSIGVIRVSGSSTFEIVQKIFQGTDKNKNTSLKAVPSHTIHYGKIVDAVTRQLIDEALFLVMKSPNTYTGEDVIEIQSHGNPYLLQSILSLLMAAGARLAEPGEFTRRAYLSGRLDLSQAEAVMQVITAESHAAQEMALHQLRGDLSKQIETLQKEVLFVLSEMEASIDFVEQGIVLSSQKTRIANIDKPYQTIGHLLAQYEEGKQIRDGVTAALVGLPNVGKSSIMNLLLGEDRAIVTPIPGTTRDTLDARIVLSGRLIQIVDTAGVRDSLDPIELEGVRRGEAALQKSDIALCILDASVPFCADDIALLDKIPSKKRILVLNKIDLPLKIDTKVIAEKYPDDPIVHLSAITGEGRLVLQAQLTACIESFTKQKEAPVVSLLRHKNALERAQIALARALQSERDCASVEFIASDLRAGLDALGEIVGETTTDAILDQIFNQFCIGK
ncbi:MAG: tRNA uridine-5-carboxymethylaminomethyl(34) synthesis GTPase MnmE [Nitrospirota bacterium]